MICQTFWEMGTKTQKSDRAPIGKKSTLKKSWPLRKSMSTGYFVREAPWGGVGRSGPAISKIWISHRVSELCSEISNVTGWEGWIGKL